MVQKFVGLRAFSVDEAFHLLQSNNTKYISPGQHQSINQSCIFRVVQVIKSLQDPLEVGNNLPGISDNVRERGPEEKCF